MMSRCEELSRFRLPWGLLGMLVAVVGIEGVVQRHDLDFVHPWSWDWKKSAEAARRHSVDCEVLCFGDSLIKFGLIPRVLEEGSGHRTYNLAIGAGPAPATYFLFRRALDAGARPKTVVVSYKPHLLAWDSLAKSQRHWPEMLTTREMLDLAWSAGDAGFFARTATARLLPSLRDRYEIRSVVGASLQGRNASLKYVLPIVFRNWRENRGATVKPPSPPQPMDAFAWARDLFPESWSCHPVNDVYLQRFLNLAESRQIQVVWLLPPVSPEVQARSEQTGIEGRYLAFVRAVQARHPALTVIDARHSSYPREVFLDPIHLDRHGAVALSHDIAPFLSDPSSMQPGWFRLPAYREHPTKIAPEDLIQSMTALRQQNERIRR